MQNDAFWISLLDFSVSLELSFCRTNPEAGGKSAVNRLTATMSHGGCVTPLRPL